jgi:putative phosphoesterase
MRLAIVSDTHLPRGRRELPEACVVRLRGADAILHAGDFVAAPVLRALEALGPPVHAVFGNVDEAAVRGQLPEELVVQLAAQRVGLVHIAGPRAGREARLLARFPGCAAVVYGHTHVPEVVRHEGVWILNPGSPTERRRSPFRSMLLLDVGPSGVAAELLELP